MTHRIAVYLRRARRFDNVASFLLAAAGEAPPASWAAGTNQSTPVAETSESCPANGSSEWYE
jgi:hypothetical protein